MVSSRNHPFLPSKPPINNSPSPIAMSSTFRYIPSLSLLSSKSSFRFTPSQLSSSSKRGGGRGSLNSDLTYGQQSGLSSYGKHHRGGADHKDLDKFGGSDNSFRMVLVNLSGRLCIKTGPGEVEVEENGIHLQYKVEQRSVADEGEGF